jgi:hypothetical protein
VKRLASLAIAAVLLAPAAPVWAERHSEHYDPHTAGHPLRVAGYLAHAVGLTVDYILFRPAWYLGSVEPLYTLFGRYHNRPAGRDPVEEVVPPQE